MLITTIGATVKGEWAWLDAPAAASYDRMLADGCPTGGITDAGRTNAEQWEMWRLYLAGKLKATAAYPGTSKHETGRALDLTGAALAWVRAHGVDYGWIRDAVRNEPWHCEYMSAWDTKGKTPTPAQEDDMPLNAADATLINTVVINVLRSAEAKAIIRDAVLTGSVSEATGTLAQTTRDARQIAAQVRDAVAAIVPATGGVAIDYMALAKAVNDDAARRMQA
jgi:hypothetical protein